MGVVLSELGEKIEGIEQVDVLLEILRVCGVKQNLPLKRLVVDLLQRNRGSCDVLREDANAVIYAEPGMLPAQEVPSEVLV